MSNSIENEENNSNSNNEESNRPACAACKHQRKKCRKGCPFLVHFPANKHQEFSAVHQIFGIANMNKMMKDIDVVKQSEVVESIIWEAMVWTDKDHKEHGPYGLYKRLAEDHKRLQEQNKQLQEQLLVLKSHQELKFQPKSSTGVIENSSTNVKVLSRAENYSGYGTHEKDNLLLSSTVNSYTGLLEGYDRDNCTPSELGFLGTSKNSTPPGLGVSGLPRPCSFFRQEQEHKMMRDGQQEKGDSHHGVIVPVSSREAMLPQVTRPVASAGQVIRRSQLENMNNNNNSISNHYSGPSVASSLESRRLSRYHPYSLPHSSLQSNNPSQTQRGLISQQYPLVNSFMQNNHLQRRFSQQYPIANSIQNKVTEEHNEVKSEAAEKDNTH